MPHQTVESLVTEGLGYCCKWFFFTHFRNTQIVADRLGVSTSAIRAAKADVKERRCACLAKEGCLQRKITLQGKLRKIYVKSLKDPLL